MEKWKELSNPPILTWLFARRLVNLPPDSLTIRSICSCSLSKLLLRNLSSSRSLSFLWIYPHNVVTSWNTNWLNNTKGYCDNIVIANSATGFADETTNNEKSAIEYDCISCSWGRHVTKIYISKCCVSNHKDFCVNISHKTKILLVH